jgi:hypothetical protein
VTHLDDPAEFDRLTEAEQAALLAWVRETFVPDDRKRVHPRDSTYAIKHIWEREPGGFYITNGAMKGAFLAAGYPIVDMTEMNWRPRIMRRKPCSHPVTRRKAQGVCRLKPDLLTGICRRHEWQEAQS